MSFLEKMGRSINQQLEFVRHGNKLEEEKDEIPKNDLKEPLSTWYKIPIYSIIFLALGGTSIHFYTKNNSQNSPQEHKSVEVKPQKP